MIAYLGPGQLCGEFSLLDGAGLQTILVLTGITSRQEAQRFPFLPSRIVDSVANLVDDIGDRLAA